MKVNLNVQVITGFKWPLPVFFFFGDMSRSDVQKWTKALPAGPFPDHLTIWPLPPKAFSPSYEKTNLRPDMKMIVSMEYRRMWFEERAMHQMNVYPQVAKECFVRKSLQKDAWKKTKACLNAPPPPLRKAKRFLNIPAKVDTGLGALAGELIPQCGKCNEFHPALEKCAATKLCDIQKAKAIALKPE